MSLCRSLLAPVVLCLLGASALAAQTPNREDIGLSRFAFGVGAGVTETEPGQMEPYVEANLRMDFAGNHQEPGGGGYRLFVQPEAGYWKHDKRNLTENDTMAGVNFGGRIMLQSVDFFGAVGVDVHRLDATSFGESTTSTDLGENVQVGLDFYLNPDVSLYALARIDHIENRRDNASGRFGVGARWSF